MVVKESVSGIYTFSCIGNKWHARTEISIIFVYLREPRIYSALAWKNIQASLIFLARLFVYLQ